MTHTLTYDGENRVTKVMNGSTTIAESLAADGRTPRKSDPYTEHSGDVDSASSATGFRPPPHIEPRTSHLRT